MLHLLNIETKAETLYPTSIFTSRHGGHISVQSIGREAMFVYIKNPVGIQLSSQFKTSLSS